MRYPYWKRYPAFFAVVLAACDPDSGQALTADTEGIVDDGSSDGGSSSADPASGAANAGGGLAPNSSEAEPSLVCIAGGCGLPPPLINYYCWVTHSGDVCCRYELGGGGKNGPGTITVCTP